MFTSLLTTRSRSQVLLTRATMRRHLGDRLTLSQPRWINSSLIIVLIVLQCFAFLTSRGAVAQKPNFRTAPQNSEVILGGSKVLNCEVNNFDKSTHTVYWVQLPSKILFDNHNRKWAPERMNIIGNLDSGEFNLNISAAELTDDGRYECQIVTFDVRQVNFTVLVPPSITFEPSTALKILEGGANKLKCVVQAKPQVTSVKWYKDGSLLPSETNFELQITSASKAQHQGTYKCEAENRAGKDDKSNQIQIQYAPKVTIPSAVGGVLRVNHSDNLNVACAVDASPEAEIKWLRDGTVQEWPGNTLIINDVRRDQTGSYTCQAQNRLDPTGQPVTTGTGSAQMQLTVQYVAGAVTITSEPSTDLIAGGQATLTCALNDAASPGEPAAVMVWTKQDDANFRREGAKLELSSLKLSDDGMYICTPTNIVGKGPAASYRLVVNEATSFLPPFMVTEMNVSSSQRGFELTCRVRGRPEPIVSWYKDDVLIPPSVSNYYKISKTQQSIETHSFNVTSVLLFEGSGRSPSDMIRVGDKGTYKCVAKSVDGTEPSRSSEIQVLYPPVVDAPALVAVDMNETALILCRAHAFPEPQFEWYNGTIKLANSDRVSIKTNLVPGVEYPYQTLLNISDMQPGDMGSYSCKARNAQGVTTATIQLTVKTWPYPPENLTRHSFTWETAHLSWNAGFDGGYPQRFYIDATSTSHNLGRVTVDPPDATMFNVSGLRPSTHYTFRVYGQNAKGPGKYSNSVDVTTKDLTIPKPHSVKYNKNTRELTFKAPAGRFCVRVTVSQNNVNFTEYTPCAPPAGGSVKLDSKENVNHVNVSLCLERRPDVCSPPVSAIIEAPEVVPMTTIIIVASVCGVIVVILLLILVILCCRRRQKNEKSQQKPAKAQHKVPEIANNGRGYENSALDSREAVDLDDPERGGMFATNTSRHMHDDQYSYARRAYPANGHLPNSHHRDEWINGQIPTDPPPSYDPYDRPIGDYYNHRARPMGVEEQNMKNYYNNGNPNGFHHMHNPKNIHRIPENGMVDMNSSGESVQYSDSNKSGGSLQKMQPDSSSNRSNESGYSTPDPTKPKKVIYEVMV